MPTDVIMPQMGESIFEGTITKWLKKAGDAVEKDEPLFEISTDKVDAEIPSPVAGVLSEIKVEEGATVQINTVVAVVSSRRQAVSDQAASARIGNRARDQDQGSDASAVRLRGHGPRQISLMRHAAASARRHRGGDAADGRVDL